VFTFDWLARCRSISIETVTIKSAKHADKLVSAVADLYVKSMQFCDVQVQVGRTIFTCHRLILALQSTFFQQRLFPITAPTPGDHITLDDDNTTPDDFRNTLRYMYTGEIELDSANVGRILRLAELTRLDDLKQTCLDFMRDTLDPETCVAYWKVAEDTSDSGLENRCRELFLKEFVAVCKSSRLQEITPDMMMAAVERDDLDVGSEVDVCEILLNWFDASRRRVDRTCRPLQLLSLVRWSGVNVEYIKSKMLDNSSLIEDQESFEYLSRVISYRLSDIQFPGLRTHHRPSTELETNVVIFGVVDGNEKRPDSYRVGLQSGKSVAIAPIPGDQWHELTACTDKNSAYATGLGDGYRETWRWDSISGWSRCADMLQGRRQHCATFVNDASMYALGGSEPATKMMLSSVEQFSKLKNKWTTVGQLAQRVKYAACAAYKTSIYLFGGGGKEGLSCVQEYDTTTQQCTLLTSRLPEPQRALRAVLWDKSVVLMNSYTCLVFDLDRKTVERRDQFAAGVGHFGLVLDDQTLFVFGGGNRSLDASRGEKTWNCTDEVKSVAVMDVVGNQQTVNWTRNGKIRQPSLVIALSLVISHTS